MYINNQHFPPFRIIARFYISSYPWSPLIGSPAYLCITMADTLLKTDSPRISILDILRGFALYGIILAHAASIYLLELQSEGKKIGNETDLLIKSFLSFFVERKFYLIFSFLFGLSFYIQFRNAKRKGQPFTIKFIWRLFVLFIIGLLHNQFYAFDILHIYAIIGLLLIPVRHLNQRHLLFIIAILVVAACLSSEFGHHIKSSSSMSLMANLGFSQRVIHQLSSGHFLMILSLFYLGYWAGTVDLFNAKGFRTELLKKSLLLWSLALGVFLIIGSTLYYTATLSALKSLWLSFCYIGVICLLYWYRKKWRLFWSALENLGRMGLTNYVLQTFFFFLLFEFGYKQVKNGELLSIIILANLFYFAQIIFSIYWFKKFSFGPLEWIWRSTTNLYKNQPLQKKKLHSMVEQDAPLSQ